MPASTLIDFVPGVGKRTAHILHQMGVHTVGQLSHIPEGVLEHIFGPSILQVLGIAREKNLLGGPATFGQVIRKTKTGVLTSQTTQAVTHAPVSIWKKFQLAARVVSVL